MSSASISKIHVTNSTGLSLNERFTAIATKPIVINRSRSRSRSRSKARELPPVASAANRRFLQQLARRHKLQAALKLKRRSIKSRLRPVQVAAALAGTTGIVIGQVKRGTIKALRIGANGRPIKTNTFARTATMNADLVTNRGRSLRRSGRIMPGGAPERVARRRLERLAGDGGRKLQNGQRGRSRSRSRSRSRLPREINNAPLNRGRSRSRSRNRAGQIAGVKKMLPIKARLGLRNGSNNENNNNNRLRNRRARSASVTRLGIRQGRVTKNNNNNNNINGTGKAQMRGRSRSRGRRGVNANDRSRSRTRRGSVGQQQQQQQKKQPQQQLGRTRSQSRGRQRNGRGGGNQVQLRQNGRKNITKNGKNQNASNQGGVQRRGRGGRNGARNLGKLNGPVKKEDLDKELDQYMSTTKTGDLDYLLK